jgi:hypothetical protein
MSSEFADDDLNIEIEVSDDQTVIALTVTSPAGKVITQNELILAVECWLHEVTKAQLTLNDASTIVH